MNESDSTPLNLENLSRILIRCFLLGLVMLAISFVLFLLTANLGYGIHSRLWTELTRSQYDLIGLTLLSLMKLLLFTFFLIPYIAIRMVLNAQNDPRLKA